jgi:hypothetical protein
MHCTNCGAPLSPGSKFCTSCGTPAPAAGTESAPLTPLGAAPPQDVPPPLEPAASPGGASAPSMPPVPPPPTMAPPPPAAGVPGMVPPSGKALPPVDGGFFPRGTSEENAFVGLFKGLFDFSFRRHATPHIVKMLFVLAIVGAGLWALVSFASIASVGGGAALIALLVAPVLFLIIVAYTRVFLELVLSVTQVEQHTRVLAEIAQRQEQSSDAR